MNGTSGTLVDQIAKDFPPEAIVQRLKELEREEAKTEESLKRIRETKWSFLDALVKLGKEDLWR